MNTTQGTALPQSPVRLTKKIERARYRLFKAAEKASKGDPALEDYFKKLRSLWCEAYDHLRREALNKALRRDGNEVLYSVFAPEGGVVREIRRTRSTRTEIVHYSTWSHEMPGDVVNPEPWKAFAVYMGHRPLAEAA